MLTLHGIWSVAKICVVLGAGAALGYILIMGVGLVLMIPVVIVCGAYSIVTSTFIMLLVVCQLSLSFLANRMLSALGIKRRFSSGARANRSENQTNGRERLHQESVKANVFDPYQVLQVTRSAKLDEIRSAYLRQMSQYHPDKVAHLGAELRAFAEEKAKVIQQAYTSLASR